MLRSKQAPSYQRAWFTSDLQGYTLTEGVTLMNNNINAGKKYCKNLH